MDFLHELEIAWILVIQALGAWLAEPMRSISLLGNEEFYLLVMPVLYWCLDATLGLRMGVMLLLTNGLNAAFKLVFHAPRPYWLDTRVEALSSETSFGLPSGHAQHAASIWGLAAASVPGKWAKAFFIVLIGLIGFSRIYLGVHFISDVLLGWLIGGLLLWAYLAAEKPVWRWLRTHSLAQVLGLITASSLLIMLLILGVSAALVDWETPEEWAAAALDAYPGNEIDPLSLSGAFTVAGTWLGLLGGAAWLYHRQGGFSANGTPWQRVLRYWLGVIGVFVLWYGLGEVFPRSADALAYSLRYLRYALVGLWISAAAPLIFQKIGLAAAPRKGLESSFSARQNTL